MSTKTSIKRIALVAVAALGFGMVSGVAANAAVAYSTTTLPTVGTATSVKDIGVAATTTIGATGAVAANGDTWSGATVSLTVPSGSSVSLAKRDGVNAVAAFTQANMTASLGAAVNATTGAISGTTAGAVNTATHVYGTITIIPDVQGTYKITVTSSDGATATSTIYASDLYALVADGLPSGTQKNISVGGVAGPANRVLVQANSAATNRLVTVSGASAVIANAAIGFTVASNSQSAVLAAGSNAANSTFEVLTPASGTITVSIFDEDQAGIIYSSDPTSVLTITVGAASGAGGVDATLSSETTVAGTGTIKADKSIYGSAALGAAVATSTVTLVSALSTVPSTQSVSVVVTGPGYVVYTNNAGSSSGRYVISTKGTGNPTVGIFADGNPGTTTVTVTAGAYTFTKSVTFYGKAASFAVDTASALTTSNVAGYTAAGDVVKNLPIGKQQWWQLNTKDAAGNLVSATPSVTISVADSTIASSASSSTDLALGLIKIQGVKAGSTTFTVKDAATGLLVLGPVTVNVSAATAASATLTLDSASYTAGSPFVLSITAKDANGLPLADGTYAAMATLSTSTLVYNSTGAAVSGVLSPVFSGGVATVKGFMPNVSGDVTFTLTLGTAGVATAAQGAVLTATAANASAAADAIDAANEATDAANAATDAANAAAEAADAATAAAQDAQAAVAALATQVASLIAGIKAQITTLTNLVIKIQKKVKA